MSDCYRAAALMSGWGAPPIPGFPSTTTWECCSPGVAPYITCDETGTITALDLSGVGWTGTVADSVSALPGLLRLDLSRNRLSGLLPAGIFGMTSLMFLNVSGNMLAGVDDMDMSYIGTVDVSGNLPSLAESLKAATGVTM
ncbi:hypothetical protein HK101_000716 [Irineochytrium annulatum]|nr:hypothetical protein HK101_000716 [Irineochytrium annulatum]